MDVDNCHCYTIFPEAFSNISCSSLNDVVILTFMAKQVNAIAATDATAVVVRAVADAINVIGIYTLICFRFLQM